MILILKAELNMCFIRSIENYEFHITQTLDCWLGTALTFYQVL